jgi:lysine decarboxylase
VFLLQVLRAQQLGASGVDIENDLQLQGIRVEMADRDTVVFLATLADSTARFDALALALVPILKARQGAPRVSAAALSWRVIPQRGASIRDAYFARTEMVAAAEAVGRVSADLIAPYPPGVAVVAPGEVLTEAILKGLQDLRASGVRVAYATDPALARYRVVVQAAAAPANESARS